MVLEAVLGALDQPQMLREFLGRGCPPGAVASLQLAIIQTQHHRRWSQSLRPSNACVGNETMSATSAATP